MENTRRCEQSDILKVFKLTSKNVFKSQMIGRDISYMLVSQSQDLHTLLVYPTQVNSLGIESEKLESLDNCTDAAIPADRNKVKTKFEKETPLETVQQCETETAKNVR